MTERPDCVKCHDPIVGEVYEKIKGLMCESCAHDLEWSLYFRNRQYQLSRMEA